MLKDNDWLSAKDAPTNALNKCSRHRRINAVAMAWVASQSIEDHTQCALLQYALLVVLAHHANARGFCHPSIDELGRRISRGKTAVWRTLMKLEERNLIARYRRTGQAGRRDTDGYLVRYPGTDIKGAANGWKLKRSRKSSTTSPLRERADPSLITYSNISLNMDFQHSVCRDVHKETSTRLLLEELDDGFKRSPMVEADCLEDGAPPGSLPSELDDKSQVGVSARDDYEYASTFRNAPNSPDLPRNPQGTIEGEWRENAVLAAKPLPPRPKIAAGNEVCPPSGDDCWLAAVEEEIRASERWERVQC